MATGTLTGSTVAARYKSLLKLTGTANDVLGADASAKYIEDGDGNDSALSISTTRVGIGTTAPVSALDIRDGLTTSGAILTLGTKEPSVVADDVLGRINFYAPLEESGTDSILVSASIAAVAQGSFSGSVNSTSLYFQTGDSEVATTKMVIDEDGNIGIGTDAPGNLLTIQGASTFAIQRFNNSSGTALGYIRAEDTGTIGFLDDDGAYAIKHVTDTSTTWGINGSTRMQLLQTGSTANLSLGVSAPVCEVTGTIFHINDSYNLPAILNLSGGTGEDGNNIGQIHFSDPDNMDETFARIDGNTDGTNGGQLDFLVQGSGGSLTSAMTIVESGNVGIGNTDPLALLHLAANSGGGKPNMILANHVADTEGATFKFRKSRNTTINSHTIVQDDDEIGVISWEVSDGNSWERAAAIKAFVDATPGNSDVPARLEFQVTADASASPTINPPAMTILNSGYVGIGNATPDGTLHVFSSDAGGVTASADADELILESGGQTGMSIMTGTGHAANIFFGQSSIAKNGYISYNGSADSPSNLMTFGTNQADRVSIDSAGNVLIGHTASIAHVSTANLQVNGLDNNLGLAINSWRNHAAGSGFLMFGHSKSGSLGSHTVLADGDAIGGIYFQGSDGNDFLNSSARITANVDGSVASNRVPGEIVFETAEGAGDNDIAPKMIIRADGNVGIGEVSPEQELHVKGSNTTATALWTNCGPGNIPGVRVQNSHATDGNYAGYFFENDQHVAGGIIMEFETHTSDASSMSFATSTGEATRTKMTLDKDGNLGIGIAAPTVPLHIVDSNDGGTTEIIIDNSAAAGSTDEKAGIRFRHAGTTSAEIISGRDEDFSSGATKSGNLIFRTTLDDTATERMRIASVGAVTMPTQPAFLVKPNATSLNQNVLPGATVPAILNTEIYDQGANFNSTVKTSTADATETNKLHDADGGFASGDVGSYVYNSTDNTHATVTAFVDSGELTLSADIMASGETYYIHKSTFTAPVTGKYQLTFSSKILNLDSAADYYAVYINTSNRVYTTQLDPDVGQDTPYIVFNWTGLADMDANDTAYITWKQYNGTAQTDLEGDASTAMPTFFSGHLAC